MARGKPELHSNIINRGFGRIQAKAGITGKKSVRRGPRCARDRRRAPDPARLSRFDDHRRLRISAALAAFAFRLVRFGGRKWTISGRLVSRWCVARLGRHTKPQERHQQ